MKSYDKGRYFPGELTSDEIAQIPVIDHGEDIYIYDTKGKRYLDAISGIAGTTS